ncbi:zinc-ribbon domain-containing protein [Candidatus Thioglobus sp.]|nr:zinc-ribbon domain-containing protein [Candidatus Thioglobus sp.]
MNLSSIPHLVKEWDYDKNYPLTPENFSYGSGKMIWWLCPKGHSYERAPNTRTSHGTGCPFCSGKKTLNHDLFK